MTSIDKLPCDKLAGLKGVLADIDDTISNNGKLRPKAYEALWRLHDAGLLVIPVTGRSAGWCDHIARFWPVDAVVGENGAFYFHYDGTRFRRRFVHAEPERQDHTRKLKALAEKILAEVPGCGIASDQPYRQCDLAIDYREDVEPLPREALLRIKEIFEQAGAHARISSIHINGWFGQFDKLATTKLCVQELFGIDLEAENESFAFCGDSPNDESMFAYFKLSFGMANIIDLADMLVSEPNYVTTRPHDEGFCEVVDLIIKSRGRPDVG